MKFSLEFDCENDAFLEAGRQDKIGEILIDLGVAFRNGDMRECISGEGLIWDGNGNSVGWWWLK